MSENITIWGGGGDINACSNFINLARYFVVVLIHLSDV